MRNSAQKGNSWPPFPIRCPTIRSGRRLDNYYTGRRLSLHLTGPDPKPKCPALFVSTRSSRKPSNIWLGWLRRLRLQFYPRAWKLLLRPADWNCRIQGGIESTSADAREKIQKRQKPEEISGNRWPKPLSSSAATTYKNDRRAFKMAKKDEGFGSTPRIFRAAMSSSEQSWPAMRQDRRCRASGLLLQGQTLNLVKWTWLVRKLNKPTGGKPGFVTYGAENPARHQTKEKSKAWKCKLIRF